MRRELEEELGIWAEVGQEVARIRHSYKSGIKVELRFFVVHKFEGQVENRIFRDVRWVDRAKLTEYDFLEADKELVEHIAAGKIV
jgi:8-oxo-dGTP diphosphatase